MKIFNKVRSILAKFLSNFLEEQAKRKIKNKYPELWVALDKYMKKTSSTGCQYGDYLVLYEHVRRFKPKFILECGTGVSTVVMSHALFENEKDGYERGKIVSLEENQWYFDHAKSIFPKEYDHYVEFVLRDVTTKEEGFFHGVGYKDIPKYDYEFVFVDGPNHLCNPKEKPLLFNFDLIEVVKMSNKPVSAVIDNRTSTAFVYNFIFGKKFRYDYIRKLGVVYPSTKEDLIDTKKLVVNFMKKRPFKRPRLTHFLQGTY
jgi:hypothetical protein